MAKPTEYQFELSLVAKALLKDGGITEGFWRLEMELTINAGVMGISPEDAYPGAMFLINSLRLRKVKESEKDEPMVFDAKKLSES